MKRIIFTMFILSYKAYCFDLDDMFEFLFEDVAQLFGIIAMILAAMYFIKRVLREDSDNSRVFFNRDNRNDDEIIKDDIQKNVIIKDNKNKLLKK